MTVLRRLILLLLLHCFLGGGAAGDGDHAAIAFPSSSDSDFCTFPDGGTGTCIAIRRCGKAMAAIRAETPLTRKTTAWLQSLHCGYKDRSPYVCCPVENTAVKSMNIAPLDISKHENIKLLPVSCGYIDSDTKIVNGNATGLFEFPWMAALFYKRKNDEIHFQCGGSIINEKYILTAAHCVVNPKNQSLPLVKVRLGEYDMGSEVDCKTIDGYKICAPAFQDVAIEKVLWHPNYDGYQFFNDIALVRVSPIDLSQDNAQPICQPIENNLRLLDLKNKNLTVAGWGKIFAHGPLSPRLLKVEVPFVPLESCRTVYAKINVTITSRQLCAGGVDGKDSCGGDSGGPLSIPTIVNEEYRHVLHGIVSFGPTTCGKLGQPGVYTRVTQYMDWILDNMEP